MGLYLPSQLVQDAKRHGVRKPRLSVMESGKALRLELTDLHIVLPYLSQLERMIAWSVSMILSDPARGPRRPRRYKRRARVKSAVSELRTATNAYRVPLPGPARRLCGCWISFRRRACGKFSVLPVSVGIQSALPQGSVFVRAYPDRLRKVRHYELRIV